MAIPELHMGHTKYPEGQGIIVKNAVYKNETQLERSFPHRHSFFVICLIRSGSGIHVIDFEEFDVKPNRLFIISPYQVHSWVLNANTNISMVQFSEGILHFNNEPTSDLLSALMQKNNYLDINASQSDEILELAMKLEQESSEKDSYSADIIRGYLLVLFRLIERMAEIKDVNNPVKSKEKKMYIFRPKVNTPFR